MKKAIFAAVMIALFGILVISILTLTVSASSSLNECKKSCNLEKREEIKLLISNFRGCNTDCLNEKKSCLESHKSEFLSCKNDCIANQNLTNVRERSYCMVQCASSYQSDKKLCSSKNCTDQCKATKKESIINVSINKDICTNACILEESPYNLTVSEETCNTNSGLFNGLCNGPYFDIVCTQQEYCLCEGNFNYSCPQNYTCVKGFKIRPPRINTISGWKDSLGKDLGEIGICGKE